MPHLAASGRTSFAADPDVSKDFYRAAGFRVCGERVVRVDILERLADLIRPASSYRPGVTPGEPPAGAADGEGFVVTVAMTSLTGCSGEAFASILHSLGYHRPQRPGPAITVPLLAAASTQPLTPAAAVAETEEAATAEPTSEAEAVEAEAAPEPEELVVAADGAVAEIAEAPAAVDVLEAEAPTAAEAEAELAPAEETPAEETPAEEAPAEPEAPALIDVWTLQRQAHAGPRRRPQGAPAHARGGEAGKEPRPARFERPQGQRRAPAGEAQGEAREAHGEHRPRSGEARKESGVRPGGGGGKPRQDHRPPRDDDRNRRGGGPRFSAPEKREKERLPDPDSPFAKLLALKAELEKKSKS